MVRYSARGASIRCVVSVAMLSEGWDAQNVTQILGLRAFTSQLLCEQVVARASFMSILLSSFQSSQGSYSSRPLAVEREMLGHAQELEKNRRLSVRQPIPQLHEDKPLQHKKETGKKTRQSPTVTHPLPQHTALESHNPLSSDQRHFACEGVHGTPNNRVNPGLCAD